MVMISLLFRLASELRAHRDMKLLEQLDDAALRDIGLDRLHIRRVARRPGVTAHKMPRDHEAGLDR